VTIEEARELILLHGYSHPNIEHPKMDTGFLGSLRPYQGYLNEENYREVKEAIRTVAPQIQAQRDVIDKELISALWAICFCSLAWGVYPGGLLRTNNLITREDSHRLEEWAMDIAEMVATLLCLEPGAPIDI